MRKVIIFIAFLVATVRAFGASSVADSVDVLVIGGTAKGVAAAVAAANADANTCLVTPFPYLGEDLVGTLELDLPENLEGQVPLIDRLARDEKNLADYDYWPDRNTPHPRAVFKNDRWERFADTQPPRSPSDCVYYEDDLNCRCVLKKTARISRIEVTVLEKPKLDSKAECDVESLQAGAVNAGFQKAAADGASRTLSVTVEVLSGSRRGERIELERSPASVRIPADTAYREMSAVTFSGEFDGELGETMVTVRKDPAAHSQCVPRAA